MSRQPNKINKELAELFHQAAVELAPYNSTHLALLPERKTLMAKWSPLYWRYHSLWPDATKPQPLFMTIFWQMQLDNILLETPSSTVDQWLAVERLEPSKPMPLEGVPKSEMVEGEDLNDVLLLQEVSDAELTAILAHLHEEQQ